MPVRITYGGKPPGPSEPSNDTRVPVTSRPSSYLPHPCLAAPCPAELVRGLTCTRFTLEPTCWEPHSPVQGQQSVLPHVHRGLRASRKEGPQPWTWATEWAQPCGNSFVAELLPLQKAQRGFHTPGFKPESCLLPAMRARTSHSARRWISHWKKVILSVRICFTGSCCGTKGD
jgi:hypothetical protein